MDVNDYCKLVEIFKPIIAIIAIIIIELYALSQGINGVSLSLSIAGISGLGGYLLGLMKGERRI